MILKTLPRKSISSPSRVIKYILESKDRIIDPKEGGFIITHNLSGNMDEWPNEYLINESKRQYKRKSNSNIITHEFISFSELDCDKVTPEILKDFAEKFIELRGIQGMFLAVPHFKENPHIHFCVGGLEYESGMSFRMSKSEFARLKQSLETYQREQYPFLEHSKIEHGKGIKQEISDREAQLKIRKGKLSRKQILKNILSEKLPITQNLTDLKQVLEEQGIKIYERAGKIYGVQYEGRNHRFEKLGFLEQVNDLEKRELSQLNRYNELEEITQQREGVEIKKKELDLDLVSEEMIKLKSQTEKESSNAEEQLASDKSVPDGLNLIRN